MWGSTRPVAEVASLVADGSLCEQEPIHIPGAIQPHGALLAALEDGLLVSHASANLEAILGRPAEWALGRPLEDVVGEAARRALEVGEGFVHRVAGPDGASLRLRAFRSAGRICVDIEPMGLDPGHEVPDLFAVLSVLRTFDGAANPDELMELAVRGLKALTGYDRVMAYRFDQDGHGEVVAESREASLEPFLGHHYPASDIPAQARRLYLRRRVGAIADSNYLPAPLLVDAALDDGAPLDLSDSALRSVSPVHRQFMRNMKTAASLTIALVGKGALWGMLVCHHQTPRVAGPEVRAVAARIGQLASLLLASLGQAEVLAQRLARDGILRGLVDRLAVSASLPEALMGAEGELPRLVNAGGALARLSGSFLRMGRMPPAAVAERALAMLRAGAGSEALAVDDLGLRDPECASEGSGALLLPLPTAVDDAIVWFRPEVERNIVWGGNPAESAFVDPITGGLSPRASFDSWASIARGRSAKWTEADLSLVEELRRAIVADSSRRAQAALRDSEARFRLIAEHSGDVIVLTDVEGILRYVSPAAERVLGWRPEDMIGRHPTQFIHSDDRSVMRAAIGAISVGDSDSSKFFRHLRPDGSWLWVQSNARSHASAVVPKGKVVVLRDATETKAAEAKLRDALERMQRMAATDELTGLANRRRLNEVADIEWRRCARENLPLSALLLDADRFKLFNDRYGHVAGDDCLRAIASQLVAVARRPGDAAARYGGEEFALLMPNTDQGGALHVANRLRGLVQGLGIVHEGNAAHGVVTVSVGVATAWPGDPESPLGSLSALLRAADAGLYRAKSEGRNRVGPWSANSAEP